MGSSKGFIQRKKKVIDFNDGTEVINQISDYKSKFDFKNFGVEDIKDDLIKCEEAAVYHTAKSIEHKFKIAQALYSANQLLAQRGNGTYVAWCDNIGITRNKSSDLINAYKLYLETEDKKALSLPVAVVREINKEKKNLNAEQIEEVVAAEKPGDALKKVRKSLLHDATFLLKEEAEIIEAEIIKTEEELRDEALAELELQRRDVKERRKNLKREEDKLLEMEEDFEKRFGSVGK